MNWKSNKVVIPIVAVLALSTGFAAGGGEPETKVETHTVTKTVASTPQACIAALDTSETLIQGPVVEGMGDAATLATLVSDAFNAGLNQDAAAAQKIIDALDEITANSEARNKEIESLASEYNKQSGECRDSSGSNS